MNQPDSGSSCYPVLRQYLRACLAESSLISDERRQALKRVSAYVSTRVNKGEPVRLTFICTHNSRRSQMSQAWAQAAAGYCGIPGVSAFSGGTEATAFDPRAVAALERTGLRMERTSSGNNPVYDVYTGEGPPRVRMFSKTYLAPPNPQHAYCAVLTCSSADRACPVITSADERVLLAYEDPKRYDGTDRETAQYDARCRQICREICWLFTSAVSA